MKRRRIQATANITHVGAKRDVDRGQFREPVPPSGRGVQDVVVAHIDHAFDELVE